MARTHLWMQYRRVFEIRRKFRVVELERGVVFRSLLSAFEQDSTKVVHVFKSTVLVSDYGWSQVRGSTALQPSKIYTKEGRFSGTAFDTENQLIRVDL